MDEDDMKLLVLSTLVYLYLGRLCLKHAHVALYGMANFVSYTSIKTFRASNVPTTYH